MYMYILLVILMLYTVMKRTGLLSAPDVNSTGNNQPCMKKACCGIPTQVHPDLPGLTLNQYTTWSAAQIAQLSYIYIVMRIYSTCTCMCNIYIYTWSYFDCPSVSKNHHWPGWMNVNLADNLIAYRVGGVTFHYHLTVEGLRVTVAYTNPWSLDLI